MLICCLIILEFSQWNHGKVSSIWETVEFWNDRDWELGHVESIVVKDGFKYRIFSLKRNQTVEVSFGNVRASHQYHQELINEMSQEMPDPSTNLQSTVSPTPTDTPSIPTKHYEDAFLDEHLILELSQEMPDQTQSLPQPSLHVSQEPWKDTDDFINPAPMLPPSKPPVKPKPSRFLSMSETDLNDLQSNSKAKTLTAIPNGV